MTSSSYRPALLAALGLATALGAQAQDLRRTVNPRATIPIATAVTVPATAELVFFSGVLPDVARPEAPRGSIDSYGDTQAQARSVLKKLQANLAAEGLGVADVVSVRVFLVGDPALENRLDFNGFNTAFAELFGTPGQPARPVRTVVQVSALPAPGALVEVDLIAARVNR